MTIHTTIAGQTQRYTVAAGQYVLDLPSAQWRAITVSGADYPRDLASATIMASYVCGYEEREIVKNEEVSTTDVAERQ